MTRLLTKSQIEQFKRDGYISPLRVVPEQDACHMRRQLEAYEAEHDGPLTGSVRFKSHLLFKWLNDLIRNPTILDAVEDLMGPDILVWSTDWWIKEAHSESFVSWHQDSQYWGLDTSRLVTVWIGLSPSSIDSGCMRVLPGSHLRPNLPHRDTYHDDNMLTRGQEIYQGIDESKAINLEVQTGEAAIFAFRIAHASHPNTSGDRRIGMAIRYIPPDARQVRAERDIASLVRGEDVLGNFEHEPIPATDFDPVVVEFHKRAEEERRQILYQGTGWKTHRT